MRTITIHNCIQAKKFQMDGDGDVFGFLENQNEDGNGGDTRSQSNFGLVNGPSKDAVIFCIDCGHFEEISRGMSKFPPIYS